MGDIDLLERPPASPKASSPQSGLADGNPRTNARGQFRGPGPVLEPEVEAAIKRKIKQRLAKAAARQLLLAGTAEVAAATAPVDWVPFVGWGLVAAEAGFAAYQGYQLYQDYKEIKKLEAELKKKQEEKAQLQEKQKKEEKEKEEAKTQGGGGGGPGNVAVTGYDPCDLQPYNKAKCPKDHQAHHVVADMVLRYGKRGSDTRIPDAPSLKDGLTICLSSEEHTLVHQYMDAAVRQLGRGSATGEGTAPIDKIVDKAIESIEKVKPECKEKFDGIRKQFEHMGDQPGRTTHSPPKPGSPAETTLKGGGSRQGSR